MAASVQTYDGYEAAVRPRSFIWEGQKYFVAEILEAARTAAGKHFRVRTADDQVFELSYSVHTDEWRIQQP